MIIDDFTLEPMSREESRDIYQLFVERNARASRIVTSNRDTADWLAIFGDTLLAQSAVDRFKNNAFDLVIDGESYRPRLKPTVEKEAPAPPAPVTKQPPPSPSETPHRLTPGSSGLRPSELDTRAASWHLRTRSSASHPAPCPWRSVNP